MSRASYDRASVIVMALILAACGEDPIAAPGACIGEPCTTPSDCWEQNPDARCGAVNGSPTPVCFMPCNVNAPTCECSPIDPCDPTAAVCSGACALPSTPACAGES